MKIDLTPNQHQFIVDLLAEFVSHAHRDAAVLLRYPEGQRSGAEKLAQAKQAIELFAHLTQY